MAGAGLVLSAVGAGLQFYGSMQQTKALKTAEANRQKQMNLDAMRERRQVVRNALLARSTATATAAGQGALFGSGVQGAYGQIEGRAGQQVLASSQNQQIGNNIFAANRRYYNASILTDIGSGLSSLGGMLINNAGSIQRVGAGGYF